MKKIFLSVFLLGSLLFSCNKDDIYIDKDNLLIGVWNYSDSKDYVTIYTKNSKFTDSYGYKFNSDGTLVERKNSGWCATPPVSYADYKGSWSVINDTIIEIKAAYWGGTTTSRLDIEYLSAYTLKFITISSESVPD